MYFYVTDYDISCIESQNYYAGVYLSQAQETENTLTGSGLSSSRLITMNPTRSQQSTVLQDFFTFERSKDPF